MSASVPQPPSLSAEAKKAPSYFAFLSRDADQEAAKAFARAQGWPEANVLSGNIVTAIEFLRGNTPPALLIVEIPSAQEAPELLNALADVCAADTKVFVAGDVNEYSFFRWLTEIGIHAYVLKPLSPQAMEAEWKRVSAPPPAPAADKPAKEPARLIGVMGARGGSGASSMAVLIASLLATESDKRVALVDLDAQDGSISVLLDLEPSRGLREAFERPERIDSLFLDRVAGKTAYGLYVLSAEESIHDVIHFHDGAADALMAELRAAYDLVIVDIPRQVHPFYRAFLKACERVYIISEPTLLGVRDTVRLHDIFTESLKLPPPVVAVNRIGMAPKFEMTMADFEKGIAGKAAFTLPYAPDVCTDISGELKPAKIKPTPLGKALMEIVRHIVPEAAPDGAVKKAGFLFLKKG